MCVGCVEDGDSELVGAVDLDTELPSASVIIGWSWLLVSRRRDAEKDRGGAQLEKNLRPGFGQCCCSAPQPRNGSQRRCARREGFGCYASQTQEPRFLVVAGPYLAAGPKRKSCFKTLGSAGACKSERLLGGEFEVKIRGFGSFRKACTMNI